jgi:hypothetical protein
MFENAADITEAVTAVENGMGGLRSRMEYDFDLYTLKPFEPIDVQGNPRKGYQAATTSSPRNFFDKVMDGLNRAVVTIQIKMAEDAKKGDKRSASIGELFLFGAMNEIDRQLRNRGEPPLREMLGFFMCLRGWFALRTLVYIPEDKELTEFDAIAWDPMHTTWERGSDGLLWAAQTRMASKDVIKAEYNIDISTKEAKVIDFWDTKKNSVIINSEFGKDPTEHNIGHVPVLIGAVGSMPTMQNKDFEAAIEFQGDSVWSASRDLYKQINKYDSWVMDSAARAVVASLVHESQGGTKKLDTDPYTGYQEIPLDSSTGEKLYPLELPRPPAEMLVARKNLDNDLQQSTLPFPLAFGGTEEAMSGRALSVLSDATRSIYNPRTGAMARAITWICEELLSQFANKGIKDRDLMGYKADGTFFEVNVKPTEIKPNWFVAIQVEPRLPRDQEKEISMALAATQRRGIDEEQLLSMDTAREEILHVRDPDAEHSKVLAEMGAALAPIRVAEMARSLVDRGEPEKAKLVLALLSPEQGQAQPPPAPPASDEFGRPTNGGQPGPAQQGLGQQGPGPQAQGGIPPEIMQIFEAVGQALIDAGDQAIVQEWAAVLQGQTEITSELVETILAILIQSGQGQLAAALRAALGLDGQQGQPGPQPPQAGQAGPQPVRIGV